MAKATRILCDTMFTQEPAQRRDGRYSTVLLFKTRRGKKKVSWKKDSIEITAGSAEARDDAVLAFAGDHPVEDWDAFHGRSANA